MFERYFCARVTTRLQAGPHAVHLERFTAYLHHRGHSRLVVQAYVRAAELFFRYLQRSRRHLCSVTEDAVRTFASRRRKTQRPRASTHAGLRLLLCCLREVAVVPTRPIEMPNSIRSIIMDYDAHLREVAGLAPATRSYRRRYACEFLRSVFGSGPVRWSRLRAEHLQDFVSSYGRTGRWAAAQVSACALRNFLRWLQFCGRTGPELIAIVPHIPRWRLAALPPVLSGNQVATLLGTFDRSTHVGRRDFAMAVCMVELGLRVSEVAGLKLEHVDLATTTVRLVGGKSRRNRILPMPRRVYQAILNYIRDGRPLTTDAHLFVRHRLPVGLAVSRELVRGVIRRAYATVPGCGPLTGTHILRHTAATRLLGAGADLKRIADILGHKSIDTTAIYAKVDMAHLTAVAAPWPTTDKEVGP